ncbi:MAG: GtrA family protein [Sciscionella sp.]
MTTSLEHAEQAPPAPGLRGLLHRARQRHVMVRLGKFAAASAVSTVISQLTLMGIYGLAGRTALLASICAFAAGSIPNFLINRHWAWGRRGAPNVGKELLPYLAVIVAGGIASTGLVTLADALLEPVLASRGWRTIILDLVYLGSYGLLFVVKFALLDRLVFRGSHKVGETS